MRGGNVTQASIGALESYAQRLCDAKDLILLFPTSFVDVDDFLIIFRQPATTTNPPLINNLKP